MFSYDISVIAKDDALCVFGLDVIAVLLSSIIMFNVQFSSVSDIEPRAGAHQRAVEHHGPAGANNYGHVMNGVAVDMPRDPQAAGVLYVTGKYWNESWNSTFKVDASGLCDACILRICSPPPPPASK